MSFIIHIFLKVKFHQINNLNQFHRDTLIAITIMIFPFLPASGIIRLGFVVAERILYIPSIGYCLLVCMGFNQIHKKYTKVSGR